MILDKSHAQIVQLQDQNISDCKSFRQEWEEVAKRVELSYKGIKFPQHNWRKNITRNDPNKKVVVNILKRQHRSIQNLFLNNEPAISVRRKSDMKFEDTEKSAMLLKQDFVESDFYDEELDNITNYGLKRGIVWVLAIMNKKSRCEVSVSDSMDTYIDISALRKKDIRHYIKTFTKSIEECKAEYKTVPIDGSEEVEEINWDQIRKDREKTESNEKKSFIKEPTNKDIILFREGWYLDYDGDKQILVKVLTIKDKLIEITKYPEYDFLPVTYYSPINDPDNLYPDSWYKGVLEPERIVNEILNQFVHIVKTGGRYVFVQQGTKITKGKNKLLESIGIEIIEVGETQQLPKEATLLNISQSQMVLLDKMIRQAEEEGGMRQDIMGSSSLGADASGKAIQALQAGSRGNLGMASIELNKFLNRLAKIYFKMYKAGGGEVIEYYDPKKDTTLKIKTDKLGTPILHIEPRSVFDDITEKADGIQMLEYFAKFNTGQKISASVIADIFKLKSDLAEKIEYDLKQEEDPEMQQAKANIKLLLMGKRPAVSETDNHEINMAFISKALEAAKNNNTPDVIVKNLIDNFQQHKAFAGGNPGEDQHRKEK